jgi:ubiquitin carboxyl-terminal hydrolase 25/28
MDLAYLALVTSKAEEEGKDSHNIEDSIVDVSNNNDNMDVDLPAPEDGYNAANVQDTDCDDVTSEITLVGDGQDVEMSDDFQKKPASAESKENVEPEVMQVDNSDSPPHLDVMKLDSDGSTGAEAGSPLKDSGLPTPRNSPPPIPARPAAVTDRKYSIDPSLFGKQQDVSESIGNVLFQLEAAIRPVSIDENGEQQDLIKECFYGQTKQTLAFPDSSEVRTKVESFAHLLVNVDKTEQDIYSALDSSFDSEQVDLEGKHARRYLSITKLPPILSIQVQRVQFNREAGSAYKSHTALNFPETLYMDRYLDSEDDALLKRRENAWKWKEELRQLQDLRAKLMESQGRPFPLISLELTKNYAVTQLGASEVDMQNSDDSLGDVGVDPLLPAILNRGLELINNRITAADNKIKDLQSRINQQFTDLRKVVYRIHAVFIHSGSHNFGHYWIYIHDFEKRVWRKYNDEHVTEVTDENIIFKQAPGDKVPTPYFLGKFIIPL